MPLYQIDIQKNLGSEYWTNVYHLTAASLSAAQDAMFDIVDQEKIIHHTNIAFDKFRVSLMPHSGGSFITGALTGNGLATGPCDEPLFNVARIEFTSGFGRPGVKMYRGVLTEGDVINVGDLNPAFKTYIDGTWIPGLLAAVPISKSNGVIFTGGSVRAQVGMRQLRRGSRRRLTPVI